MSSVLAICVFPCLDRSADFENLVLFPPLTLLISHLLFTIYLLPEAGTLPGLPPPVAPHDGLWSTQPETWFVIGSLVLISFPTPHLAFNCFVLQA